MFRPFAKGNKNGEMEESSKICVPTPDMRRKECDAARLERLNISQLDWAVAAEP